MGTPSSTLIETGRADLAGRASSLSGGAAANRFAAGDDLGEVGIWELDGRRLAGFRLRREVRSVCMSADGERTAVLGIDGQLVLTDSTGLALFQAEGVEGSVIRLSADGDCVYCIDAEEGRVGVMSAVGRPICTFDVPRGVSGFGVDPSDGNLVLATRTGVVLRLTPWGTQVWATDLKRECRGVSFDGDGSVVVVAALHLGARGLRPSDGMGLGAFDPGSPVVACSASRSGVLLGTTDGEVALLARGGSVRGTLKTAVRPREVYLGADGAGAAVVLHDGGVRLLRIAAIDEVGHSTSGGDVPTSPTAREQGPESLVRYRRRLHRAGWMHPRPPLAISQDARNVCAVADRGETLLLDRDGEVLDRVRCTNRPVLVGALGNDGALVLTRSDLFPLGEAASGLRRAFPMDVGHAVLSPDRQILAVADALGGVKVIETHTGRVTVGHSATGRGPVTALHALAGSAVVQFADSTLLVVSVEGTRELRDPGRDARLVAVAPSGPVLVTGDRLRTWSWHGDPIWERRLRKAPRRVLVGPAGQVFCETGGRPELFGADGNGRPIPSWRPDQVVVVLGSGRGTDFLLAEGRRLCLCAQDGRPWWLATMDGEVHAAAVTPNGGAVAAVAGDHLFFLTAPGAPQATRAGPGGATVTGTRWGGSGLRKSP